MVTIIKRIPRAEVEEPLKMQTPHLRQLRESALLSQQELADLSGVSRFTIQRLESTTSPARGVTIRRLAKALGVLPAELMAGRA